MSDKYKLGIEKIAELNNEHKDIFRDIEITIEILERENDTEKLLILSNMLIDYALQAKGLAVL